MHARTSPPFHAELLRPDDLLHLQVDGDNLALVKDDRGGALVTVADPQRPAFIRFSFGPQTIAESAFFEAALVDPNNVEPDPKRADSDFKNTVHEAIPAPGTVSDRARAAAAAQTPPRTPTVAQLGHPSRLVFEVPPDAAIAFSIAGLLDWAKLRLSVNPIAAIGDAPSAAQVAAAPDIRPPTINETALELPYKLVISPTRDVAWLHRAQPFTSRGRTELWHTRMALQAAGGVVELSKTVAAPLRAIWSADYDPARLPAEEDDPELGRTAMSARDRHQLVVLTSAFRGYQSTLTLLARRLRPIVIDRTYLPQPFHAERLMLSALGGWLRSRGQWDPPRRAPASVRRAPDFAEIFKHLPVARRARAEELRTPTPTFDIDRLLLLQEPAPAQLDLSEWVHVATQGRDHYVKIVYEGELWPFRHPAALIKITERKFVQNAGIVGACLMQRMFVVVRRPLMRFADDDRGNPLKSVTLTTLVTPDIADPAPLYASHSFWVEVMTTAGRDNFRFHAVGVDIEGNTVDFTVPMMFVSRSDLLPAGLATLAPLYNQAAWLDRRSCAIPGQKLALAPRDPLEPTDTTELATDSLNFIMDARVQPTLLKAGVEIPQVQELLGTRQPTSVRLYPAYVAHGLDDPSNLTGVFAQVVPDGYDTFSLADPVASLGLKVAAEKAGGMATPNMALTTLSRKLGPLAGKAADAVQDKFDPAQFFPRDDSTKLFGSFDLLDILLPNPIPPAGLSLGDNAPVMRTERKDAPGGGQLVVTTLDWKPKFLDLPPDNKLSILGIAAISKDNDGATSVLQIHATITKPLKADAAGATTEFSGSLNDFTVSVLDSVFIQFKSFRFRMASNEKVEVAVQLDPKQPLHFGGDLAFVEEIRNAIPPGLFGDGPSIELLNDPLGIRAGFAFALPPLTVGVFTLKDVKLGAALTLPFLSGKPVFDFNISERPHPFLLAVGIFGGGGFFHLQLDTAGMKALEVALEFGATAALDIGVASGEVHIMAGIYFSLQRKEGGTALEAVLTGYLRMGGSLNVLCLIRVSVEFNLSFTYDSARDKAYGRATLTVSVHVLMFSTSVELTVERAFGGSGDPHFIDLFPDPEPWREYALAFA